MQLYIEGYRSNNQKLYKAVSNAAVYYCALLLGPWMVRNIYLEIKLTKDLKKKEQAYGYCHIVDDDLDKPREFMIELDASMKHPFDQILIWLAHEMVHLKQFVRGELFDYEFGKSQWKSRVYNVARTAHDDQPWEREAYRLEGKLFEEFSGWYYE